MGEVLVATKREERKTRDSQAHSAFELSGLANIFLGKFVYLISMHENHDALFLKALFRFDITIILYDLATLRANVTFHPYKRKIADLPFKTVLKKPAY